MEFEYDEKEHEWDDYATLLREVHPNKSIEVIDAGEGYTLSYEWDVARVYEVNGGEVYYLGHDNGCSCSYYGDNAKYNDLMQFSSKKALLDYLRSDKYDYRGDSLTFAKEFLYEKLYAKLRTK